MLYVDDAIWRDILTLRYVNLQKQILCGNGPRGSRKTSTWWNDIQQIGRKNQAEDDLFTNNISSKLGVGSKIFFLKV